MQMLPRKDAPTNYAQIKESDLVSIETLDLRNPWIFDEVKNLLGIYVTTRYYSEGIDEWVATPADGPAIKGTFQDIVYFIRGYGRAWYQYKLRMGSLVDGLSKMVQESHWQRHLPRKP